MNNVSEDIKTALSITKNIIYNSEMMMFDWNSEYSKYLEIKMRLLFENIERFLGNNFINNNSENKNYFIITHNMVALRELPDREGDHPVITHSFNHGVSYWKSEHFKENRACFSQEVDVNDIVYELIKMVLKDIRAFKSDNIMSTILWDYTEKMEIKNKTRKHDFSIKK